MKQLTVQELYNLLTVAMVEGHGDKLVVVSDDVEGNGYHGLFYGVTADTETVSQCIGFSNGISDSLEHRADKIVIIG